MAHSPTKRFLTKLLREIKIPISSGCTPTPPPRSPGMFFDSDDDDSDESLLRDAERRQRRDATLSATAPASHQRRRPAKNGILSLRNVAAGDAVLQSWPERRVRQPNVAGLLDGQRGTDVFVADWRWRHGRKHVGFHGDAGWLQPGLKLKLFILLGEIVMVKRNLT